MTAKNIRNRQTFYSRAINIVLNGIESLSKLGPQTWEVALNDMKIYSIFTAFEIASKQWKSHALTMLALQMLHQTYCLRLTFRAQNQLFLNVFSFLSTYV